MEGPATAVSQAPEEKDLRDIIHESDTTGEGASVTASAPGPEDEDAGIQSKFDIPILVNERVEYFLKYFQNTQRAIFTKWLARSERYIPMMKKILRDHGLPEDLVYMAMIESGFNPKAYSRRRACGPWQFIPKTGTRYGLKVDWWVDERRDPEKSTVAAAGYLQDLYEMFGSWYLAAAAYNAGEKKIVNAMLMYRTQDFWEMSDKKYRYLKRETKEYVPKLIAAALIAKDPEKYGFSGIEYEAPVEHEVVTVPPSTSLRAVAKASETEFDDIKVLNASLLRGATPPFGPTPVKVPKGKAEVFARNFPALEAGSKISFSRHIVLRGETLSEIARAYGVEVEAIRSANNIKNTRAIRPGRELTIPLPGLVSQARIRSLEKRNRDTDSRDRAARLAAAPPPVETLAADGESRLYEVREGDTLWDIAQRYNVSISDIRRWNGMRSRQRTIHPGQKIRIQGKTAARET